MLSIQANNQSSGQNILMYQNERKIKLSKSVEIEIKKPEHDAVALGLSAPLRTIRSTSNLL